MNVLRIVLYVGYIFLTFRIKHTTCDIREFHGGVYACVGIVDYGNVLSGMW